MFLNHSQDYEYQVGGSLSIDAPSYVEREADSILFDALVRGDFCYVFNSRQMGKSSLRVRVKHQLQQAGFRCVSIDITSIGSERTTPEQWYKGVANELFFGFDLQDRLHFNGWWQQQNGLSPVQKLSRFIEDVLLSHVDSDKLFIFIDEIDSILSLDFSMDDFFALIRSCYNQRADRPLYNRLTFALFGVSTPSDLIQDRNRTPFNTGQAIELHGFQLEESQSLIQGMVGKYNHPEQLLAEILLWTNGQPFLTQKLCQLVVQQVEIEEHGSPYLLTHAHLSTQRFIGQIVQSRIIHNWKAQDNPEHLRTIQARLLRDDRQVTRLLGMYEHILQAGSLAETNSDTQGELLLSGLVVKRNSLLQISNRIYQTVFNQTWVRQHLEDLRPYSEALTAWLKSGAEDDSRLLRGQALEDAQAWSMGKSLTNEDYQFLAASQALDKQIVQNQLALESAKNQEQKRREEALRLIMEGTVAKIGDDFFSSCVRCLAKILDVEYALIAVLADETGTQAQFLAFSGDDELGDVLQFDLAGTPCGQVVLKQDICHYPHSLQSRFPENPYLVSLNAHSYIGIPILDNRGGYLGHLAVMDTQPSDENIADTIVVLKIFAARAGAELQRKQTEARLEQHLQRVLLLEYITQEVRQSLDTRQILQTTANQIGHVFAANRCLIFTYLPYPMPHLPWAAEYCEPGFPALLDRELPAIDTPYLQRLLSDDQAISSPKVWADPLLQPLETVFREAELKSMIAVRTSCHGEPNGFILIQQCDRIRQWTQDEIELAETVATRVGIALAQAKLIDKEKEHMLQLDQQNHQLQQEITERKWTQALLDGQNKILNLIARGTALPTTLNALAKIIEDLSNQALCSVLLLDKTTGKLHHGAAPSLPQKYNQAIDGLQIGPMVCACGTAAYTKQTVVITDIATDPRSADFKDEILKLGLRACWSTPILMDQEVVATFAMYYREPRSPDARDIELVAKATELVNVAIERHKVQEILQQKEDQYKKLVDHASLSILMN